CFENNAGAAMLLGNTGVGKSSLLQLLKSESAHLRPFLHLSVPRLSSDELSRSIACALLERETAGDLPVDALLVQQHACLRQHVEADRHPVIVLDEAHLMSNDTLNEVVLPLLNLAETDFTVRLSVVLVGQPVLGSHIARNAQLRERISVTATMSGMSGNEAADYIIANLSDAGCGRRLFTDCAVASIMDLSGGNPRLINRICDMALLV
ncbi:MAG: AAA family ATPase, partial [Fuerstiella sp.]|nr:AAA family ATPase [Fuerstiella sp.]